MIKELPTTPVKVNTLRKQFQKEEDILIKGLSLVFILGQPQKGRAIGIEVYIFDIALDNSRRTERPTLGDIPEVGQGKTQRDIKG